MPKELHSWVSYSSSPNILMWFLLKMAQTSETYLWDRHAPLTAH